MNFIVVTNLCFIIVNFIFVINKYNWLIFFALYLFIYFCEFLYDLHFSIVKIHYFRLSSSSLPPNRVKKQGRSESLKRALFCLPYFSEEFSFLFEYFVFLRGHEDQGEAHTEFD
jgi:hypothetical protein